MKKLLLILIFLTVSNTVYANGKILKSGFITKSASVKEGMNIDDPKNKIIIICFLGTPILINFSTNSKFFSILLSNLCLPT